MGLCPFGEGSWVPLSHDVARAEAYMHAKFHRDPSGRLAAVHQRHRQTGQRSDSIRRILLQTVAQKWGGAQHPQLFGPLSVVTKPLDGSRCMPLGTEVGLGPGHIVLDGDPASPRKMGTAPPIFGPCLLWPNGWMDQDATWYGGRPRPRPHCVNLCYMGTQLPPNGYSPQFSALPVLTERLYG